MMCCSYLSYFDIYTEMTKKKINNLVAVKKNIWGNYFDYKFIIIATDNGTYIIKMVFTNLMRCYFVDHSTLTDLQRYVNHHVFPA